MPENLIIRFKNPCISSIYDINISFTHDTIFKILWQYQFI